MASPVTDNLVKVTLRGIWNGETALTVFHATGPSATPQIEELEDICNATNAWWAANLRALQGTTFSLIEIHAESYRGLNNSLEFTHPVGLAGTASGDPEPNNVCLVTSFRSGFTGRSRRGRAYTPGITGDQTLGTYATPTYADDLAAAWGALQAALGTVNAEFVIASFTTNGAPRPSAFVTTVAAVVITDLALDSQRRRLPGRGR